MLCWTVTIGNLHDDNDANYDDDDDDGDDDDDDDDDDEDDDDEYHYRPLRLISSLVAGSSRVAE